MLAPHLDYPTNRPFSTPPCNNRSRDDGYVTGNRCAHTCSVHGPDRFPQTPYVPPSRGFCLPHSMGEDFWGRVGGSTRKRLVIYQRDKDRQLLAMEGVMSVLGELLGSEWELVPIVHDNSLEPCWLYSQLMDADMLLTPHGCGMLQH